MLPNGNTFVYIWSAISKEVHKIDTEFKVRCVQPRDTACNHVGLQMLHMGWVARHTCGVHCSMEPAAVAQHSAMFCDCLCARMWCRIWPVSFPVTHAPSQPLRFATGLIACLRMESTMLCLCHYSHRPPRSSPRWRGQRMACTWRLELPRATCCCTTGTGLAGGRAGTDAGRQAAAPRLCKSGAGMTGQGRTGEGRAGRGGLAVARAEGWVVRQ